MKIKWIKFYGKPSHPSAAIMKNRFYMKFIWIATYGAISERASAVLTQAKRKRMAIMVVTYGEDNMGGAISGFDILCLFLSKTVPHLGKNETVLMKEME